MTFLEYIAKAMADRILDKETFYDLHVASLNMGPVPTTRRFPGAVMVFIQLDPAARVAVCEELRGAENITAYIGLHWIADGFRVIARVGSEWNRDYNMHSSEGAFSLPKDLRVKLKLTKSRIEPPDWVYDQVGTWMWEEGVI